MEVDGNSGGGSSSNTTAASTAEIIASYKPLLSAVQSVYQNVTSLARSFRFKSSSDVAAHMSNSMPCAPPFNIDFNSLRRAYMLLFGGQSSPQSTAATAVSTIVIDELEKCLDMAVYALCFKIRMTLKNAASTTANATPMSDTDLTEILHALLIVNELPLLEDPKYMDRCAKIFYATINELPVSGAAMIARLWSKWHGDELKVYLNKVFYKFSA